MLRKLQIALVEPDPLTGPVARFFERTPEPELDTGVSNIGECHARKCLHHRASIRTVVYTGKPLHFALHLRANEACFKRG